MRDMVQDLVDDLRILTSFTIAHREYDEHCGVTDAYV